MRVDRPKFEYIRSEKLMKLYRTIPCQNCHVDNGTVCGAHSNQAKHGKGRGIKASDIYCASLCADCHFLVDNSNEISREEKLRIWNAAYAKTWEILWDKGKHLLRSKAS